jgi:hypothetical protein
MNEIIVYKTSYHRIQLYIVQIYTNKTDWKVLQKYSSENASDGETNGARENGGKINREGKIVEDKLWRVPGEGKVKEGQIFKGEVVERPNSGGTDYGGTDREVIEQRQVAERLVGKG